MTPTRDEEAAVPDAVPIEIHPVMLRQGDRLLADPDQDRPVDWTITTDAYPVGGLPTVEYVTDDGAEGTHTFERADPRKRVPALRVVPPLPPLPQVRGGWV